MYYIYPFKMIDIMIHSNSNNQLNYNQYRCRRGCERIVVVSSNPAHGVVNLIQHYVIKFVSDLRQVSGFFWVLRFSPNKI